MTAINSSTTAAAWDARQRARALIARRETLQRRLPRRISAAQPLDTDIRGWIVDDAIEFAVIGYEPPVHSRAELERVFWDAATKRVARAHEGRYDTIRAGYRRADLSALRTLSVDETPEDKVLAKAEVSAVLHFAALLEPHERDVFACQQRAGGNRQAGTKRIARELGLTRLEVLRAQRSIDHKHERFAIIYAAGRLCNYLAPAIEALAATAPDGARAESGIEAAAHFHLHNERCPTCRADYARQLRALRSARFHHQVAALLPATTQRQRAPAGWRDALPDWTARLLAHDPATTTGQLVASGAGRGIGATAAAKLASLCLAGAGTVGACLATGVLPLHTAQPPVATPTPTATATPHTTPTPREDPLPHGAVTATPTATPAPKPKRKRRTATGGNRTTQGGTGPTDHEQTPASPAPSDAPANGAGEFDPDYQPSAPPAPAPAPVAPGSNEFF